MRGLRNNNDQGLVFKPELADVTLNLDGHA